MRRVKNRKVDSHTGEGEEGEGDAESDSDEDVIPPYLPPLPGKDAYQNGKYISVHYMYIVYISTYMYVMYIITNIRGCWWLSRLALKSVKH